mmetsp:Transcript_26938/g.74280  ORF Transcript_26938/g.74280 Transcript_26938/m.74280 type:complete len:212 (+) Transcript_26938:1646-2281(+)
MCGDLLSYMEYPHVLGEFGHVFIGNVFEQCGFSDTIFTNETVPPPIGKLELAAVHEKCSIVQSHRDIADLNVLPLILGATTTGKVVVFHSNETTSGILIHVSIVVAGQEFSGLFQFLFAGFSFVSGRGQVFLFRVVRVNEFIVHGRHPTFFTPQVSSGFVVIVSTQVARHADDALGQFSCRRTATCCSSIIGGGCRCRRQEGMYRLLGLFH